MSGVDAAITTVIISVAALAGVAVIGEFVTTLSLPDGLLRAPAVSIVDGSLGVLVLAVTLVGGFGFVVIRAIAGAR
jgi:hypothetical protein